MLLDRDLFRAALAQCTPKETTAQTMPPRESPKQMTAKELHKQMGIAFTVVASPLQSNDAILNHIPSDKEYMAHFGPTKQMSLRQLRDQMGIHFQIVSSTDEPKPNKSIGMTTGPTGPAFA